MTVSTPARPRSGRLLVDVTELINNPIRTGIQRVVRALLQHWPDPERLVLCRHDAAQGLVPVSPGIAGLLRDPVDGRAATPPEALTREIGARLGYEQPAPTDLPILVPEVFFDPARCAHHRGLLDVAPRRTAFIAYDFIPYLHPDSIGVRETANLMPYIQLLRDAARVGFISNQTRHDYATRITRRPQATGGPVFPLGADGPGIPRQTWSPVRRSFLNIGSIDGRKNQDLVLDAFERLWARGMPARLVMVGRVFESRHVRALKARIARLAATQPMFSHQSDVGDEVLAALYGQARATIYASEIEGFGLPPVESLHCGVPVIASARVPSIADLPPGGHVRLERVTADAIALQVQALMQDAAAEALWDAAAGLRTDTWADMAAGVAAWVQAG